MSINNFKVINQKSRKYFDLLEKENKPLKDIKEDKEKERIGFNFFVLENLTGIKDFSDLLDIITDSYFHARFFGENFDDLGIDAVNIDEENNIIQLFNFKFREKFGGKQSRINEAINSTKFLNAIKSGDLKEYKGKKIKEKMEMIIKILNKKQPWDFKLFIVSNENVDFEKNKDIKNLEEQYSLEVENIGLEQIANFISIRPEPINVDLIIDKDSILSFSEDSLSSKKSYILKLPLYEVVRITCKDKELRKKCDNQRLSILNKAKLDFSVLFDNVRGFVNKSKYNKNIIKTLKEEPTKFFIYNNGLTLVVDNADTENKNLGKAIKLSLKNLQVVNGGQTLRSIYAFNEEDGKNIKNGLSKAQVLVRILNISEDESLDNKIAEYTNSQNAISVVDLKSLKEEQINIEQYLSGHNILYVRKSGDTGDNEVEYEKRISMERFGQILFSLNGFPEKASNKKKSIFDEEYENLFVKNFNLENSINQINRYFEIREKYKKIDKKVSEQKIFYILYLDKNIKKLDINQTIKQFEKMIKYFPTEKGLSDARKLIRNDFKEFVNKKFKLK
ncbi:MAG: hypothetical protein UT29_C0004G0010 [Candidatus Yanofskybacteria bacterium GW2011_GWA1_39_13]|uniref:Abortive phage infection protein C-terminal domain-containing protein n=1 Tax=Yanofskybacteria sp. (strain GW2011_GWA1_39_13) TaxID=1619019 RepID=A0A0G0QKV5_YANXG|nr:MAG: hypothetical protein UT29_C0004G0010 [Candidatus Yanofskybacteria bacterium GW2011_GWA1_39_13]